MINKNNRYFKEFAQVFKRERFKKVSGKILKELFGYLLKNEHDDSPEYRIDLGNIEELPRRFYRENTARILDGRYLSGPLSAQLLDFVRKYENYERMKNIDVDVIGRDYKKEKELAEYNTEVEKIFRYEELQLDEIIPDEDYDYPAMIENFKRCEYLRHLFNHSLPAGFSITKKTIQRASFHILNSVDELILPITYRIECKEGTCANIARFTDFDLVNSLKCNKDTGGENSHTLKIGTRYVETEKILFGYSVSLVTDNEQEKNIQYTLYSFNELDDEYLELEVISVTVVNGGKASTFIFSLCSNDRKDMIPLEKTPFSRHRHTLFLEDIYNGLVSYLKEYQHIEIRDDNRYIAYILIFQLLSKLFHDMRFYSFIIGESGSGKTFWSTILPRLFTGFTITVSGESVSKNVFLGGLSIRKSFFNGNVIEKGVVGTKNLVVVEEAANALNAYHSQYADKVNNLFSMIKLASGEEVPATTQGTAPYRSEAALFLTGNFEQLAATKNYRRKVAKKYHSLTNKHINYRWPMFKPLDYYKKVMMNDNLADAHYHVRTKDEDYVGNHYILRLPPAEMARFQFFVAIENDNRKGLSPFGQRNTRFGQKVHRDQLVQSLRSSIDTFRIHTLDKGRDKKYGPFFSQIYEYLYTEFFMEKHQNFRYTDEDINQHVKMSVLNIAKSFFLFQKQYYGLPLELTAEDRTMFVDFMRYNYNTLSLDEARMIDRPFFNNHSSFDDSLIMNRMIDIEDKKEKEAVEQSGKEVAFGKESSEDNIFNNMEEFE